MIFSSLAQLLPRRRNGSLLGLLGLLLVVGYLGSWTLQAEGSRREPAKETFFDRQSVLLQADVGVEHQQVLQIGLAVTDLLEFTAQLPVIRSTKVALIVPPYNIAQFIGPKVIFSRWKLKLALFRLSQALLL